MRTGFPLTALLGAGCAASEPQWTLTFTQPVRSADGKGIATVRIEKVEPELGKVTAKHVHVEGDRIGWWPEAPDVEPVSLHRVHLPYGKSERVDFNTGLTLKSVLPVRRVISVKRCVPIFNKIAGDKMACEVRVESRPFATWEIVYGRGVETHRVYVPEPTSLNQLCPLHAWNPDAQVAEERVLEARALLKQADRLWATDAAAAIPIYQRLLKEFGELLLFLEVLKKVESRAGQADQ